MARILILDAVVSTLSLQRGIVGAADGHTIHWYALAPMKATAPEIASITVSYTARIQQSTFVKRFLMPLDVLQLAALIRHLKIDLIHVHYAFAYLLPLAFPPSLPVIVTTMGGDILADQSYNGRFRPPWTNRLLERANAITVKSAFLEAAVTNINPAWREKLERITWGVDTTRFRPGLDTREIRQRHNLPDQGVILFDLRLGEPFYRKHVILKAFARITAEVDAYLLIATYRAVPAYIEELRQLADSLGVMERVRFVGAIPHEDMPLYLNLADVNIAIPPSDGLPQSLYEAMACGSFPIMSDLPQYRGLLEHGVNTLLVPAGEDDTHITALADAVRRIANDADWRRRAALDNRNRILHEANEGIEARRILTLYERLLAHRHEV